MVFLFSFEFFYSFCAIPSTRSASSNAASGLPLASAEVAILAASAAEDKILRIQSAKTFALRAFS